MTSKAGNASRHAMEEEEDLPRSCCSIDPEPIERKVVFNMWAPQNQSKNSQREISDRFLPLRKNPASSKNLVMDDDELEEEHSEKKGISVTDLLKMEVLGQDCQWQKEGGIQSFSNRNILKFHENESPTQISQFPSHTYFHFEDEVLPLRSQKLRKINKVPTKVLDAPALYDDFYLNLVDWSASNLLAVGLSNSVYIWNAGNSKVVRLVELNENDLITSVSSTPSSNVLGVGTHSGELQLWDCVKNKKISTILGHSGRVGSLAWNTNNVVATGSRDKTIIIRDVRQPTIINKLTGHRQEVCGLRWSFDQQQLASGGNDNKLNIWSVHTSTPTASLLHHTAAVKALAWSPHQHGLLVSGGGTADRTIRFWNSVTGEETKCLDVGSQVCNLMFSKNTNELVSTHGYSLNEINIWRLPTMDKVETLTGHTFRVLYLAMNPDSTTIVTGAGDETLRFWNIFPKKEKEEKSKSALNCDSLCLR